METRDHSCVGGFRPGSLQPVDLSRPVGACGPQHGHSLADSEESVASPTLPTASDAHCGLVSGRTAHDSLPRSESEGASAEGNLGILGEASAAAHKPLRPPGSPTLDLRNLKPGQLLSVLNSTSFGRVISERQLLRDRQHAGLKSAPRVNLLHYMAWLRNERSIKDPSSDAYRRFQKQRRRSRGGPTATAPSHDEVFSLLEWQEYRCALTGRKLTPVTASLDHILPVSRNGPHTIDNAQIVLKEVNRAKGTLTNEEFIAICRAVVRHADNPTRHSPKETQ